MSLIVGSEMQGMCANWRLGPDADPGWFDTSGSHCMPGNFVIATVFKLHWHLHPHPPDGIYNVLHAVTMGRAGITGKTHLEQLAQILQGDLHITCRITDSTSRVQRRTVALPGSWQRYQDRAMLLIYTGQTSEANPTLVQTTTILYDVASTYVLQKLSYQLSISSSKDLDFVSWPAHRVICDHEQNQVPRDHVIVHGHCHSRQHANTPFELISVWGSLGQTLDPSDRSIVAALTQNQISDRIGPAEAWYNCHGDRVVTQGPDRWALCTGLYQQSDRLGILLSSTG
jgi:hypothetical protein